MNQLSPSSSEEGMIDADDDDDEFVSMAARVALRRYSSTKLVFNCSCSSIDLDWRFLWETEDRNAEAERTLLMEGESKPRKPTDSYVCFKKWNHPGTVKWRQVLKAIASKSEEFPEWHDDIYELVRIDLHETYGIRQFLVCRDADGKPSKRNNAQWYLATSKEILDRTKQRFAAERKAFVKGEMRATDEDAGGIASQATSGHSIKRKADWECSISPPLSQIRARTSPPGEMETLTHLEDAMATLRNVVERASPSFNHTAGTELSSEFVEHVQWLNQFVQSHTHSEHNKEIPYDENADTHGTC